MLALGLVCCFVILGPESLIAEFMLIGRLHNFTTSVPCFKDQRSVALLQDALVSRLTVEVESEGNIPLDNYSAKAVLSLGCLPICRLLTIR